MILSEQQLNNLNKETLVIIADTNRQIELLTEQIRIINQRQFGRHSESGLLEGQLTLFDSFNEAEATADFTVPEPEISEVIISSYRRKKSVGKRDADLDGLPARIIEHRLSEDELSQLFPNGYKELLNEVYRRLHIIPEIFIVDEHHVHVYASKDNDGKLLKHLVLWTYSETVLQLLLWLHLVTNPHFKWGLDFSPSRACCWFRQWRGFAVPSVLSAFYKGISTSCHPLAYHFLLVP
ncbi:MAG: transposase [Lachnospiraceae bacterium]|nr:transposase [Lachnospiraceae bacterium]